MGVECEPGAVWFIQHYFYDCVYTVKDGVGFTLGLASILLWITAQLPQFLDNIKNQSADALSIWFLAQWFLGDTLNLLGCLMSGQQLPTTTALAMYFVVTDVLMLTQYVYYGALQKRKQLLEQKSLQRRLSSHRRHSHPHPHQHVGSGSSSSSQLQQRSHRATAPPSSMITQHSAADAQHSSLALPPSLVMLPGGPQAGSGLTSQSSDNQLRSGDIRSGSSPAVMQQAAGAGIAAKVATVVGAASLLSFAAVSVGPALSHQADRQAGLGTAHEDWHLYAGSELTRHDRHEDDDVPWWQDWDKLLVVLGSIFGVLSTLLYLGSRVSQIYKNWSRKSAEGLSVVMFIFTITANICTGSSILLRLKNADAFKAQLPWICGAFGTVGLDMFIFHQAHLYNKAGQHQQAASQAGQHTAVLVEGQAHISTTHHGSLPIKAAATPNPLLTPLIAATE